MSPARRHFDTLMRRGVITPTNLGAEVNPDVLVTRGKFTDFEILLYNKTLIS